jgi:hypothetical protein
VDGIKNFPNKYSEEISWQQRAMCAIMYTLLNS